MGTQTLSRWLIRNLQSFQLFTHPSLLLLSRTSKEHKPRKLRMWSKSVKTMQHTFQNHWRYRLVKEKWAQTPHLTKSLFAIDVCWWSENQFPPTEWHWVYQPHSRAGPMPGNRKQIPYFCCCFVDTLFGYSLFCCCCYYWFLVFVFIFVILFFFLGKGEKEWESMKLSR